MNCANLETNHSVTQNKKSALITRPEVISLIFSGINNKISSKYNVLFARRYSLRSICKTQCPDDLKILAGSSPCAIKKLLKNLPLDKSKLQLTANPISSSPENLSAGILWNPSSAFYLFHGRYYKYFRTH